jgi:ribonuclease Z
MELTFLGTASSCPSKYRNVTALYLDLFDSGGLLLDVGEDTLGQMKRRWGNGKRMMRQTISLL